MIMGGGSLQRLRGGHSIQVEPSESAVLRKTAGSRWDRQWLVRIRWKREMNE